MYTHTYAYHNSSCTIGVISILSGFMPHQTMPIISHFSLGIHPSNPQNTQTSKCVAMIHPRKNSILMLSRSNHGIFRCLLCFLDVLKGSPPQKYSRYIFQIMDLPLEKNITITLNKFMGYSPRNILYMIGVFYCNVVSWDSNIPCCLDL